MVNTDSRRMATLANTNDGPRPYKRQKIEASETSFDLQPLPPAILLLSLPPLLAHPPSHRHHACSLFLTRSALRKCLSLSGLDYMTECRAWTELAEVGFRIGLDEAGVEGEVERAITKALFIVNKHPSLRQYRPRLAWLSAKLASIQKNTKFAQTNLKKLFTNFLAPSDPPHITYFCHLAYISSLSSGAGIHTSPNAIPRTLGALHELQQVAVQKNHPDMVSLGMILELQELMVNGMWQKVHEALQNTEEQLNLARELGMVETTPVDYPSPSKRESVPNYGSPSPGDTSIKKVLTVDALIVGTLFYTYVGDNAKAQSRMKKLHEVLESGALDAFGKSGVVKVEIPDWPSSSLEIQVPHPRIVYALAYLVSSVVKRDPVGRKPKRRLYAQEGVLSVDRELRKAVSFPIWAPIFDVQEFQQRMHRIKADMICELIGVAITRSEFEDAERDICRIIAHTRTYGLFSAYGARITLHQAHLLHALSQSDRALQCYQVAAFLSRRRAQSEVHAEDNDGCEDYWVNVSARAGGLWLRIGMLSMKDGDVEEEMESLRQEGADIVKECEGLGGTLQAVGAVLRACLSSEFLVSKTHLRTALNLTTASQDNHLRALVLALVASQYVHTSGQQAEVVLSAAEQLASGLGARPKVTSNSPESPKTVAAGDHDGIGNAPLRLWIGERSLELKRRAKDEASALKQICANKKLERAVENLRERKLSQIS